MKTKMVIGAVLLASQSACSYGGLTGYGSDFVRYEGTPKGIEALTLHHSALITNSKASNDADSSYWINSRMSAAQALKAYSEEGGRDE